MNPSNYQQRNVFTVPHEDYPITVVDLNLIDSTINTTGGQSTPLPNLEPSTYAETWFPADYWLSVHPRADLKLLSRHGNIGDEGESSFEEFNKVYDVQTDNVQWARLVLNPAICYYLLSLAPADLVIDAGRLVLKTGSGWLPVEKLPEFVDTVQRIARSARAAEA